MRPQRPQRLRASWRQVPADPPRALLSLRPRSYHLAPPEPCAFQYRARITYTIHGQEFTCIGMLKSNVHPTEDSMTSISPYLPPTSRIFRDASFPAGLARSQALGFFSYLIFLSFRQDGYAVRGRQDKVSIGFFFSFQSGSFHLFHCRRQIPHLILLLSVYPQLNVPPGRFFLPRDRHLSKKPTSATTHSVVQCFLRACQEQKGEPCGTQLLRGQN